MGAPKVFVFEQQMDLNMERRKYSIDEAPKALWILPHTHTV